MHSSRRFKRNSSDLSATRHALFITGSGAPRRIHGSPHQSRFYIILLRANFVHLSRITHRVTIRCRLRKLSFVSACIVGTTYVGHQRILQPTTPTIYHLAPKKNISHYGHALLFHHPPSHPPLFLTHAQSIANHKALTDAGTEKGEVGWSSSKIESKDAEN